MHFFYFYFFLEKKKVTGEKTHVGHANGLGLARRQHLLHLLPGVDVVVAVDDVALAVGQLGELVVVA